MSNIIVAESNRYSKKYRVLARRGKETMKAKKQTDTERLTLTVDEAAALLGVHRLTVYAAVKAGDIPSIRIGNRILIPRARLEDMLNGTV